MSKLFLGNFHFEHELSEGRKFDWPNHLERLNAELSFAWLAICLEGDVVYCPSFSFNTKREAATGSSSPSADLCEISTVESLVDLPRDLEPHPWGWSKPLDEKLKRAGFSCDAPNLEIVKFINSRNFAADLEEEYGLRPENCFRIENMNELKKRIEIVSKKHRQWVIKAQFGMSGRERMRGIGTDYDSTLQNWAEKRIHRDGEVFLEPWWKIVEEIGIQIEIPVSGNPVLMGVTQLICDEHGAFRTARFDQREERNNDWKHSIAIALQTANRIQSMGYFGPLGIDAAKIITDSGEILERPLLDLNARYTMGRLSLGLQWFLHEGEQGYFTVQRKNSRDFGGSQNSRSFSLSPQTLDGKPVDHRFVVVCGKPISNKVRTPGATGSASVVEGKRQ